MAEGDPVPQSSVDEEDGEKRRLVKGIGFLFVVSLKIFSVYVTK